MLTTLLKGLFAFGISAWYSVAIMSAINDYFRTEFIVYMKNLPTSQGPAQSSTRNIDNINMEIESANVPPATLYTQTDSILMISNENCRNMNLNKREHFLLASTGAKSDQFQCVRNQHSPATSSIVNNDRNCVRKNIINDIISDEQQCLSNKVNTKPKPEAEFEKIKMNSMHENNEE